MKIEGQHTFQAPRELVWKTVQDPNVLAAVLPGCEDFQETGENEFTGTLKIKVGPVQGKFKGTVALSDLIEPSSYNMRIQGKGAPGFVDGSGQLRLEEDGDTTVLHYEVDAKVGGRIASVGQRLLDSSSKVITRQALEGLDQQVTAQAEAAQAGEEPPTPVEAPSQSEFAADFTKGMVDELVPKKRRPAIFGFAGLAGLAVGILIFRSCGF
ncbi:MAG: carbon monoxide dehydrogenase subunit G [Acidobacteriota bacterium]